MSKNNQCLLNKWCWWSNEIIFIFTIVWSYVHPQLFL